MLLRLITWPYVRKHLLRCALTTAGIVLGVAVFVGMHTANQSVLYAFNRTVDKIAGTTQLQVTAGETGFPEEVLERVQAHPGVGVAAPVIEATVQTGLQGEGNLLVLGVDMTGDRNLRDYELEKADESIIDDPLVFLAQPDSVIVSEKFCQRNGLKLNDHLTMRTMEGPKKFTIRGVMQGDGLAAAYGGNLAIMDIYAAQMVFGRGRTFDRIDLSVAEGQQVAQVRKTLQAALGPGLQVDPPNSRGQQFEAMAKIYSVSANISSLFALFIGLFLIYNTFSIAVTQRRSEIGILRALGATQGQVKRLFLLESGIAGLLGSLVGLGFGLLIARGMARYISDFMGEVYGVAQRAEEISADPRLLLTALFLGVATSLIAGWIPARNAAAVDPVKALQKGRVQVITEGENRLRRWSALTCLVLAVVSIFFSHQPFFLYSGYLLSVLAALLLTPALCSWLAALLRPVMKFLRPVEGALAADSILQSPRRTSGTVAALSLSVALVIGLGGVSKASYETILNWADAALNPDLFVSSSQGITQRSFRFPASLGEEIRVVEGIDEIQAVRTARIVHEGTPVMLVAAEVHRLAKRVKMQVLEGDPRTMYQLVERGQGVVISDNFALLRNVHKGNILHIMTPSGQLDMPILGVVVDYSDQQGTILMDRRVFVRYWKDDTINVFRVYLKRGYTQQAVRQELLRRFGERTRFFVLTNGEIRAFILKITDQWFGLTYVQIFVAVLVAILGIVNTLTVSIADRKRELGVLQAVGGLRSQVRHTIWMEALAIGTLGLLIGYALGAVNLYYILEVTRRDIAGMRLNYRYPFEIALTLIPVMLGAALLSGAGPAEAAVRGSLVEALEYE
ncbi:FtsX-like permease family protein [Paludibaculum fermentans]|uniref:ABC transporter permease n=1 Tax=Paludibaculum fermentans TaxID=1473598 RepID=UPI003EBCE729